MAVWATRAPAELETGLVLSPERYDPRKHSAFYLNGDRGIALSELVLVVRETITTTNATDGSYLVFDTSHARDGLISVPKATLGPREIGSAKKRLERNDVIISRLRPYLRQVALIDAGVPRGLNLLGSTEFFVLRSRTGESIAFLVPFLLTEFIQKILSASQEGGHHPRFSENTLTGLRVPEQIITSRRELSEMIIQGVALHRRGLGLVGDALEQTEFKSGFGLLASNG